jgi:hypothetical protein
MSVLITANDVDGVYLFPTWLDRQAPAFANHELIPTLQHVLLLDNSYLSCNMNEVKAVKPVYLLATFNNTLSSGSL